MTSHWNLSDIKFPEVSRTLFSILVNLNNAVVWMVSTLSLISKSYCSFISPLVTVPRAPITIGTTVTFTFHSFFNSLVTYLLFHFLSVFPSCQPEWNSPLFGRFSFFVDYPKVWWLGNPFLSQNLCEICGSGFLGQISGYTYNIVLYGQI